MNNTQNSSQNSSSEAQSKSNKNSRLLNFIYNSNNRLIKKDFTEKENNSEKLTLASLKKELFLN